MLIIKLLEDISSHKNLVSFFKFSTRTLSSGFCMPKLYALSLISCGLSKTELLNAAKFAVLLLTSPFESLNLSLSLFVDDSSSVQFGVSVSIGVISGKVLCCPWGVLLVLVPSFTKRESRSCLVFLLIKIPLSTSFEILSLNSTSLKFARFFVIY